MATKTSKRAGETSTTVSVGIRIDPKIKFALDIMGRLQKRSLTAVIEWAISNAIAQQLTSEKADASLTEVLDKVWSTDESTRLAMLAVHLPSALTYDELRIWETIRASGYFWHKYSDGTFSNDPVHLQLDCVRDGWRDLCDHVEKHRLSPTIVPIKDEDIIPF